MRTGQGIATQSAKMKRTGKAIAIGVEGARRLERSQVKKLIRTLSTCKRVTNEIRTRKEFAGAVEATGEVIVQVKWVTTAHNEHAVETAGSGGWLMSVYRKSFVPFEPT